MYYYLPNQSNTVVFSFFFRLENSIFWLKNSVFGAGDAAAGEQGPDMFNFPFNALLIGLHLRYS